MGQARVTVHIVAVLAPKRVLSAVVVGKRMTTITNRKLIACLHTPWDLASVAPLLTNAVVFLQVLLRSVPVHPNNI